MFNVCSFYTLLAANKLCAECTLFPLVLVFQHIRNNFWTSGALKYIYTNILFAVVIFAGNGLRFILSTVLQNSRMRMFEPFSFEI